VSLQPEAVLGLYADGQLIERTPTGGDTSSRNSILIFLLELAVRLSGLPLKVFDSSCGFLLPDGSVRSPDASLGWLLLPESRAVEVWRAADAGEETAPQRIGEAMGIDAGLVFPGLAIDLREIWAA
jgi:Uma2 family endonuclease